MEEHDRTSTSDRRPFRSGSLSHRLNLQRLVRDLCRLACGASRGWLVALVLMPLVNGGCVTSALWEERNPNKRVWIPASRITEEELRQKGRQYETIRMTKQGLKEIGITSQEDQVGYLAEKSRQQKLGDSVVLAVATPVTVAVDAAIVVGVLAVGWECLYHPAPDTLP